MGNESIDTKRKHEDVDDDDDHDQPVNQTSNARPSLKMLINSSLCIIIYFLFLGNKKTAQSRLCPYLDTINRNVLDFDFEKLCSVSLTRINVYACLVCGKYFQGFIQMNLFLMKK